MVSEAGNVNSICSISYSTSWWKDSYYIEVKLVIFEPKKRIKHLDVFSWIMKMGFVELGNIPGFKFFGRHYCQVLSSHKHTADTAFLVIYYSRIDVLVFPMLMTYATWFGGGPSTLCWRDWECTWKVGDYGKWQCVKNGWWLESYGFWIQLYGFTYAAFNYSAAYSD